MRSSDYFQKLLLDQDEAHIWIVNRDYELVFGNAAFFDFNNSQNEILAIGDLIFKNVVERDELYKWHSCYNNVLKGETLEMTENIKGSANSDLNYFRIQLKPLWDETNEIIGITGRALPSWKLASNQNSSSTNWYAEILHECPVVPEEVKIDFTKYQQIVEQTSELAQIGSWEIDFSNKENGRIYWSPVVKQIMEVDDNYNATLDNTLRLYHDTAKVRALVTHLIENGQSFDEELLITTGTGKDKWVRLIGKALSKDKIYGSIQDIHSSKNLQHQIKEILSSISDAFYALDKDFNFTYFNKEAEKLLKKSEKDVIGRNLWKIFPESANTILEDAYLKVRRTNNSEYFEYFYVDNNWYEINVYPWPGGLSVYFKNINKRKQIAKEREEAFEEKKNILESIGDAFFTADNNFLVTYWNRVAEQTFLRNKENAIGTDLSDLFSKETIREFKKAKASGHKLNFEEHIECMNMWFEVTVYPTDKGISAYFKDVSVSKLADRAVKEANERYEKVTEATEDAIWDWDIKSDILYRSNNIKKFFGDNAKSLMTSGNFWQERFHRKDLQKLRENIEKSLKDPSVDKWEMEYRISNEDDEEIYVIDRCVIIRDADGNPIRMVGAMTDLTKQKTLERQLKEMNKSLNSYSAELERSNEELEQFAFVTSHDLQEPLRMISSFMEQLKRKYEHQLDEKALQYIHYAIDGAQRMKQIILDLLEFSRANRPTDEIEKVDLNDILSDFNQSRRKTVAETNAVIEAEPLPIIKTYKAVVTQIFHSLLDNALKYKQEENSPTIQIRAKDLDTEWEFAIEDNGIGIDPQFYDKIFVMFQRLHNREAYDGTGIGLSIAKRCVEFLHGRIWLESQEGQGTTFYFTLPKKL